MQIPNFEFRHGPCLAWLVLVFVGHVGSANAQDSSLFHQTTPAPAPPTTDGQPASEPSEEVLPVPAPAGAAPYPTMPPVLQRNPSYYHQPLPRQRILRIHDVIEIRVDEAARMSADGVASTRKNGIYEAVLEDWIAFDGLNRIKPAPQRDGDATVGGTTNQTFRANSQLVTRESLVFNIAAEIADIRPNGNIVLEAHKSISNNDNRWEISLSGECQDRDIGPDNVVLSRNIINLKIDKRESGQARDGYRRGWLSEFISRFQPF